MVSVPEIEGDKQASKREGGREGGIGRNSRVEVELKVLGGALGHDLGLARGGVVVGRAAALLHSLAVLVEHYPLLYIDHEARVPLAVVWGAGRR